MDSREQWTVLPVGRASSCLHRSLSCREFLPRGERSDFHENLSRFKPHWGKLRGGRCPALASCTGEGSPSWVQAPPRSARDPWPVCPAPWQGPGAHLCALPQGCHPRHEAQEDATRAGVSPGLATAHTGKTWEGPGRGPGGVCSSWARALAGRRHPRKGNTRRE